MIAVKKKDPDAMRQNYRLCRDSEGGSVETCDLEWRSSGAAVLSLVRSRGPSSGIDVTLAGDRWNAGPSSQRGYSVQFRGDAYQVLAQPREQSQRQFSLLQGASMWGTATIVGEQSTALRSVRLEAPWSAWSLKRQVFRHSDGSPPRHIATIKPARQGNCMTVREDVSEEELFSLLMLMVVLNQQSCG